MYERLAKNQADGVTFVRGAPDADVLDLVSTVDVLIGTFDARVVRARAEAGSGPPYMIVTLGEVTKGVPIPVEFLPLLDPRDRLLCSCHADRAILGRFLVPPGPECIPVLPNPVDITRFTPDCTVEEARAALNVPTSCALLVYAGRITPQKNVHALIELARSLLANGWHLRLTIAGAADTFGAPEFGLSGHGYRQYLERYVKRRGLADHVHFVGQLEVDELRTLYRAADLVVNATVLHDENFGIGQVEAMAAGAPVIGSDWGGLKDTVRHGTTGRRMRTRLLDGGGVVVDWLGGAQDAEALLSDHELHAAAQLEAQRVAHRDYGFEAIRSAYAQAARDAHETPRGAPPWTLSATGVRFESYLRGRPGYMAGPMTTAEDRAFYREVFSCYSSNADPPELEPTALLYERGPIWRREGVAFLNDFLWPVEEAITGGQCALLRLLEKGPTPLSKDLPCGLREAEELVQSGLIGATTSRDGVARTRAGHWPGPRGV
jgi:glycosyltransferase involved in cell wall biosynthesis